MNYTDKPRACSNCCHYTSTIEYAEETNRRCKLNGMAISAHGTCDLHNKPHGGFPLYTTIELGTTINITDGPYKGVWEATQGGWRKI